MKNLMSFLVLTMFIVGTYHIFLSSEENHSRHVRLPAASASPSQIQLSPKALAVAHVQVVPVQRKHVQAEVRLFGKVAYDETRLAHVTSWVPGRIERLYLNFTGIRVHKGDHMVDLYSPPLLTAQEELIQALQTLKEAPTDSFLSQQTKKNLESARIKLKLWGILDAQIQEIERTLSVQNILTIHAPISGIVIKKDATEGSYVDVGTKIYAVADLQEVWIKLEAYETDFVWLRYAQDVEFTTDALPGRLFSGKIVFIDPFLNEKTRTAAVRINVNNVQEILKPGMFVRAIVRPYISASGEVLAPDLKGKWISPMHPEIIQDKPGVCPVCGMPLVSAESLGYVTEDASEAPLVLPATAPLLTGKRAIVYVQSKELPGTFEARQIVLGPRVGDHYIVLQGLKEGELVVIHGNFKIDSASQILAKPSMMSPEGGVKPPPVHHHAH